MGFRSTRFRTGDGHVVTIPNGDLANKTIINISRRRESCSANSTCRCGHDLPTGKFGAGR